MDSSNTNYDYTNALNDLPLTITQLFRPFDEDEDTAENVENELFVPEATTRFVNRGVARIFKGPSELLKKGMSP